MHLLVAVFALAQAVPQVPIPTDSAESIRRLARTAERDYEYLLRSLAPVRRVSGGSSRCDEVVGRFCLTYDTRGERRDSFPEEAGPIKVARQRAVESLRRAFAALPGELTTAGPLVRYLIEDGRSDEAVSAARAFRWASGDSIWGPLLEGYALHAQGDDTLAERRFDAALARLDEKERRRYDDLGILLSAAERKVYRALGSRERSRYEEAFWRLADPLYLLPGNARRVEHMARHVGARLLSERPSPNRVTRWGDDLTQLTVRYGVPTSRERILSWSPMTEEGMIEYYDPNQVTLDPDALWSAGFPAYEGPGSTSPLERPRARSGYAPGGVRRLVSMPHQVARFPIEADSFVVRFRAALPIDRAALAPSIEETDTAFESRDPERRDDAGAPGASSTGESPSLTGLFILDQDYRPTVRETHTSSAVVDTIWLDYELRLPAEMHIYSLEAIDGESRLAGRARYRLDPPKRILSGPLVSDILVAYPYGTGELPESRRDPNLRPRAELDVSASDTLGLYAEASRLTAASNHATRYRVDLALRSAESPVLVVRAARWLGRQLGLTHPRDTPELSWEREGRADELAIVAVDLALAGIEPGLYALELTVTDLVANARTTTDRLIRIRKD